MFMRGGIEGEGTVSARCLQQDLQRAVVVTQHFKYIYMQPAAPPVSGSGGQEEGQASQAVGGCLLLQLSARGQRQLHLGKHLAALLQAGGPGAGGSAKCGKGGAYTRGYIAVSSHMQVSCEVWLPCCAQAPSTHLGGIQWSRQPVGVGQRLILGQPC